MANRYVWEKTNWALVEYSYQDSSYIADQNNHPSKESPDYKTFYLFTSTAYTSNSGQSQSSITYTLTNPSVKSFTLSVAVPNNTYFQVGDSNRYSSTTSMRYNNTGSTVILTQRRDNWTAMGDGYYIWFVNPSTAVKRYSSKKSSALPSYGYLSASSSNAYPTDKHSGDCWYDYKGFDTIDPIAVTYDASTVIAGETVSVTISPSSGNIYGGTITYIVQTNTDEQGWETELETTSTSVSLVIPDGSVSWRVRVQAKDNMGFTSSDYVYGNNAVNDPTTVIYPSVFAVMPEDKNLGYLATGQVVTYLVTTDDNVDYNIVVTVDGTEILSETQSPKARILTLSDEVWNNLSAEQVHTVIMTITQGDKSIVREFTFKKFVYDYSNLKGLFDGIARAIRIKRVFNK